MKHYWIVLALILVSASCEDKKTKTPAKEEIQTNNQTIKDSTLSLGRQGLADGAARKQKHRTAIKDSFSVENPMIKSQAELKDFLYAYGEENPENRVRIKTSMGDIEVRLFDDTPLHRANFILLVKEDYFKGSYMHRVSPDFIIQGGNSDNYELQDKRARIGDYLIPNEASSRHTHVRGALSSAKYTEMNVSNATAPFEFFIVQAPRGAHHLDGEHTVFGEVTQGMDVVDKINAVAIDEQEWPLTNIYLDAELID
ncbi:peptidylprolyl isomerase [Croceiramulus getboli]|nr:peptidylprolyl isomerase [Flavobacteriaceae bacterium YJPT1-3]